MKNKRTIFLNSGCAESKNFDQINFSVKKLVNKKIGHKVSYLFTAYSLNTGLNCKVELYSEKLKIILRRRRRDFP